MAKMRGSEFPAGVESGDMSKRPPSVLSHECRLEDRNVALRVDRIAKRYVTVSGALPVIDSVSFEASARSWTTILGPSGCGKTTLLRIVGGLLDADGGSISIAGGGSPGASSTYLPQHDTLLPWRSALDNAILAAELVHRPREAARAAARELFAHFGLAGFEHFYPSQLSGGMRQRVALIRTFLADRDVLLLDEPLGALDPLTRATLQDWLLSVWSELRKTILLVTHDVEEALVLSDRVIVLSPRPASIRKELAAHIQRPRARFDANLMRRKAEILDLVLENRR